MKLAVIVFPGTNRERDLCFAIERATGHFPQLLWHQDTEIGKVDGIILPGGFSYGDYLRCGAIAAHSPIMQAVRKQALRDVPILGICNGFQILLEMELLPGALLRNQTMKFMCKDQYVQICLGGDHNKTPFLSHYQQNEVVSFPIANHDGNYQIDADGVRRLEGQGQIALRYCGQDGTIADQFNPNGSAHHIAGVISKNGRILGMMPHPENACFNQDKPNDGQRLFEFLAA